MIRQLTITPSGWPYCKSQYNLPERKNYDEALFYKFLSVFLVALGLGSSIGAQTAASVHTQKITFAALPQVTYSLAPITLSATSSSGLPVSFAVSGPATLNGNSLTTTGAGKVTVTASQAGNASYEAASPV